MNIYGCTWKLFITRYPSLKLDFLMIQVFYIFMYTMILLLTHDFVCIYANQVGVLKLYDCLYDITYISYLTVDPCLGMYMYMYLP